MAFDLLQTLGLGSKGGSFNSYDPYKQQRDQYLQDLQKLMYQGQPEWKNLWQQTWQDELMPSIQETYQAKRNLGSASTPEVAQLGKAGRGLLSDLSARDLSSRLAGYQLMSGAIPGMITQYTPPQAGLLENLLNIGSPILGSYIQGQSYKPLIDALTGGGVSGQKRDIAQALYDNMGGQGNWDYNPF